MKNFTGIPTELKPVTVITLATIRNMGPHILPTMAWYWREFMFRWFIPVVCAIIRITMI